MADRISGKTNSYSGFNQHRNPSSILFFSFQFDSDTPEFTESGKTSTFKAIYLQSSDIQFLQNQKSVWFHQLLKLSMGIIAIIFMGFIGLFISKTSQSISNSLVEINIIDNTIPVSEIDRTVYKPKDEVIKHQVLKASIQPEKRALREVEVKNTKNAVSKVKLMATLQKEENTSIQKPKTPAFNNKETIITPVISEPLDELAQAKIRARSEGKLVLVKFGAHWCAPCKVMDETVLKDARILDFFETSYIYVNMDIEDIDVYTYKKKYKIKELPTLLIFNSKGNLIDRKNGGVGSSKLVKILQNNQLKANQEGYAKTSLR